MSTEAQKALFDAAGHADKFANTDQVVPLQVALAALQALREEVEGLRADSERLEWVMHRLSRKELRRIGIETSSGGPYWTRTAIDAAIRNGGEG
jgi:hypothetical protein